MQLDVIGPLGETAVAKCIMQVRLGIVQAACVDTLLSKLCLQVAEKSVVLRSGECCNDCHNCCCHGYYRVQLVCCSQHLPQQLPPAWLAQLRESVWQQSSCKSDS